MKAIVCKEFGPPSSLVYEDVEVPELKKSQILVDVHAAGVNFPDTLIIQDKYQVKPPLPFHQEVKYQEPLVRSVKALLIGKLVTRLLP